MNKPDKYSIATIVFSFFLLSPAVMFAAPKHSIDPLVEGQEYWKTAEECLAATGPDILEYVPRTHSSKSPPKELRLGGLSRKACLEVDLPELGKDGHRKLMRGFIQQSEGAFFYFDKDGKPVLMEGCLNKVYSIMYFPEPVGPKGDKGDTGADGQPGHTPTTDELTGIIRPEVQAEVGRQVGPAVDKAITDVERKRREKEQAEARAKITKGNTEAGASAGISRGVLYTILGVVAAGAVVAVVATHHHGNNNNSTGGDVCGAGSTSPPSGTVTCRGGSAP